MITAISRLPSRTAEAARLNPEALMKPVLDSPISQLPPRTRPFVFTKATRLPRSV